MVRVKMLPTFPQEKCRKLLSHMNQTLPALGLFAQIHYSCMKKYVCPKKSSVSKLHLCYGTLARRKWVQILIEAFRGNDS